MPEKITLEDGTEREVLTDEEVKNLQAGHDANKDKKPIVEQYNKTMESLDLKDGQTSEEKIGELKESENPNWKNLREEKNKLREENKLLRKKSGIDENIDVSEKKESLTREEVLAISDENIKANQIKSQKAEALSKFNEDDAKTISVVFDKLNVIGGSFSENMGLAIEKVLPGQSENLLKQAIGSSGGTQPTKIDPNKPSSELKSFGMEKLGLKEEDFNK